MPRVTSPTPPTRVRARLLVRFLDRDVGKENRLRGLLRALQMVRKDSKGAVVIEQLLEGGKP